MKRYLGIAAAAIAKEIELRDVLVFSGLSILAYGVSRIFIPAGWIVLGAGLFAVGYFGLFEDWMKLKILLKHKIDAA